MNERIDLEAAVQSGIISQGQADRLRAASAVVPPTPAVAVTPVRRPVTPPEPARRSAADDEPFRVFSGLNDLFIAIGIAVMAVGLFAFSMHSGFPGFGIDLAICIGLLWLGSEYLTKRLRMAGPSNALVFAIAVFGGGLGWALNGTANVDITRLNGLFFFGIPLVILAAHYARFRVPMTLGLLALLVNFFVIAFLIGVIGLGDSGRWGPGGRTYFEVGAIPALVCGITTFALAMWYDTRDPTRVGRQNICGFWLHLVAAPMIVHPLASYVLAAGGNAKATPIAAVFALLAVLAVVALVIDRRAILATGFGYLGGAIAFAITQVSTDPGLAPIIAALLIGGIIIALGVGWRPLREALFRILPDFPGRSSLPPVGA